MKQDNYLVLDIEATGKPWNGRIVCLGCKNVKTGELKTFYDSSEEVLIVNFLKYFNHHQFTHLIGYNLAFDYRTIVARCLRYRIKLNQFQYVRLIDVMTLLKEFKHGRNTMPPGKLNHWANYLLGHGKLQKSGSIRDLMSQGRLLEVLEYNRVDVEITYKIWKRINQVMEV